MKQGCKVYRRAGVTHVCHKGFHYMPSSMTSAIDRNGRVDVFDSKEPDSVTVQQGSNVETWVKTVIGNDDPAGYARAKNKAPKKTRVSNPRGGKKKSVSPRAVERPVVDRTKAGLPDDEQIDCMLRLTAPNDSAYELMRVCWHNWLRITVAGNRNLVPFSEFNYTDPKDTERVRKLGARLGELFKDVYVD